MDCLQYFSCWFFPSTGQTTNTIARKNGLRYETIVRRSYGTNEWHSCSLHKRIRTDGPVSQAELAAHDKLSLPVCLARPAPKRGGSCGNPSQAADGSVLFRSMPFPCPQTSGRSLWPRVAANNPPPWDSITSDVRGRLLFARVPHVVRRFGISTSRALNVLWTIAFSLRLPKPDDSRGKRKGMARNESRSCELGGKFERYTKDRNSYEIVYDKSSICRKLCKRCLFYIVIAPLIFLYVLLRIKIPTK